MTDAIPRQDQRHTDTVIRRGAGHIGFAAALIIISGAFDIVDALWSSREPHTPAASNP